MPGNARHRNRDSQASFDSLLDTMTNVVGILVILLVVTQVGVRDALRRIRLNLPDVSEAQLAEMRRSAAADRDELADLVAQSQALSVNEQRDRADAVALREDIARLLEALAGKALPDINLDEVRKAVEALAQKISERDAELRRIQEEIAHAKALLDRTPRRRAPPPRVVRLPNPRPAQPNTSPVWFTCAHNRVARADIPQLIDVAIEKVLTARPGVLYRAPGKLASGGLQKWKGTRGPEVGLADQVVYDPAKVVALFRERDIGTRDHRLEVRAAGSLARESLFVKPRRNGGESVRQIGPVTSRYQTHLRAIDPAQHYVRFLVWPDSFDVYIEARKLLERREIPAGWTIHTSTEWHIASNFGLNLHGEKDPPPAPPPAPGPAPPPRPPPLVLD